MTVTAEQATTFTNDTFPRLLEQLKNLGPRAHFHSEQSEEYLRFIAQYPLDSLPQLTLDQYCVGKGDGGSFCWWIERGLQPVLARYMPGTSRGHLLYFQKDGAVYKHQRLASLGDLEALRYTLTLQHCVAAADPDEDLSWIDDDELLYRRAGVEPRVTMGHGRKLRLVTCYHPTRMLPISSCDHLGHFLEVLGWPTEDIPAKHQPMARMQRLMRYYDLARESLPKLTPYGFMMGLYSEALGLAPQKEEKEERGTDEEDDPMMDTPATPAALKISAPLNQILYGPPGTGKTYHTINKALEILEPALVHKPGVTRSELTEAFIRYQERGQIAFVTFHQSFSYEDFVEGIRAVTGEASQLEYRVEAGVFKRICDEARETDTPVIAGVRHKPRIWKISIDGTGPSTTRDYCLTHGEARLGAGHLGDLGGHIDTNPDFQALGSNDQNTHRAFSGEMSVGDVLICIRSNEKIEAIGVVTGDYRFDGQPKPEIDEDYCHVRPVNWLYQDVGLSILPLNQDTLFTQKTVYPLDRFSWGDLLTYLHAHGQKPAGNSSARVTQPFILIIDEINRGNVSRIFGELITLIEPSKRAGADEALTTTLPYSKKPFSVPDNLYLIGTMNTADRSLAGLDIALRRRFVFEEMPPKPELLAHVVIQGVNVGTLLDTLNQRIELLLDRDHCLGHAYFMPLKEEPTLERLGTLFKNQVLPLLQEYFFEDWQRIAWVLNDHRKSDGAARFLAEPKQDVKALLGDVPVGKQRQRWTLNPQAFENIAAYALTIEGDKGGV